MIAFEAVTGARGGRVLFQRLSFSLGAGAALLVTGPNGTGKSSLIRIAAGLLRPVEGRVEAARCTLMGEEAALDPEQPLVRALGFWAALDGGRDRLAAALATVGLGELAAVPMRLLSTGQRRRAAFARVLASGATVWLLDEPANGLDAVSVAMLEEAIAHHRASGGVALIATHLPLAIPGAQAIMLGVP